MFMRKLVVVFMVTLLLFVIATACQPQSAPQATQEESKATPATESTLERARRLGYIRVGFANEAPFAYATADGTLTGESVEVARAIFKRLGIAEMDGVLTEFGSLIPGLRAGRFDAITAGMYIRPARCEQVLFGDPDYKIGPALIVKRGNPLNLHSYEDIAANPQVKVGTGAGYAEAELLKAVGVPEDRIVLFPDGPSGIAGLQAGRIDVWTSTEAACLQLLSTANDPNLEIASPFTPPVIEGQPSINYGAVAFRFEDRDLRDAYNAELAKLKQSGELLQILSQFPGFGEWSLPGDMTADQLCPNYKDLK